MNRKEMGEKISVNLAIQGEVEGAKAVLKQVSDEKADADKVVEAGKEAQKLSDNLAIEVKDATANLKALENDLEKSDAELESAGAKVPRLMNEVPDAPTNIKF